MKEDHMKNGQLKPGYNLQLSSNNQYITHYSIHQATTDSTTLPQHVNDFIQQHQITPDAVTADAGYGSEENYQYLADQNITAYVKHNQFDREQNSTIQNKKTFAADKLHYNKEQDYYVCPMGQHMKNTGTYNKITSTGFIQTVTKYQAKNCNNCPLNGACPKSKGDRIIEMNHRLNELKQQANQRLLSEEGIKKRKQRCWDVEPVFANIKNNHGFKRFMLRGKQKVTTETGLLALAHNLRKKAFQNIQKAA